MANKKFNRLLHIEDDSKAEIGIPITPSDASYLPQVTSGVYVGQTGDLVVTLKNMKDGESINLKNLAEGSIHPISAKKIWSTGTTATDILAIY